MLPVEEGAMDGIEFGQQIARLRTERRTRTKIAILWQSELAATQATAADCVRRAKEPLRRFDALRRRPGPDPLAIGWPAWPGRGPYKGRSSPRRGPREHGGRAEARRPGRRCHRFRSRPAPAWDAAESR